MTSDGRKDVARTVADEPGRLRRGSAVAVLALLAGSALTPVAIAAAGGGAVAVALAGVAGNAGSGYLTIVVERVADRLRGRGATRDSAAVRDVLAAELEAALEQGGSTADDLRGELMALLAQVDGVTAAIDAAGVELRAHLTACFTELSDVQRSATSGLHRIDAEQRRQGRQLRRQASSLEEIADRLRRRDRTVEERPPFRPVHVPVVLAGGPGGGPSGGWHGGIEVSVGERVFLLHSDLLDERWSADRAAVHRQARVSQILPAAPEVYGWLRRVEAVKETPGALAAVAGLQGEGDLLAAAGRLHGVPRLTNFERSGRTATLLTGWPASRSRGVPCAVLEATPGPVSEWAAGRLLRGLAGLCGVLATLHRCGITHRGLTPAGLVELDDGDLVLRDLGLAAVDPEPGQGPVDYQAPEQRRRGGGQASTWTDVYQVAAIAYHLLTGRLASQPVPVPVRAIAPTVPDAVGRTLVMALDADPRARPDARELGAVLQRGWDDLPAGVR